MAELKFMGSRLSEPDMESIFPEKITESHVWLHVRRLLSDRKHFIINFHVLRVNVMLNLMMMLKHLLVYFIRVAFDKAASKNTSG